MDGFRTYLGVESTGLVDGIECVEGEQKGRSQG